MVQPSVPAEKKQNQLAIEFREFLKPGYFVDIVELETLIDL